MFAPGAGRFLGPAASLAAVLLLVLILGILPGASLALAGLFLVAAGLTAFFAIFFRDPERAAGPGVVSAADGRVRSVERVGDSWRISVFMNVSNVHVNRFPLDGRVEAIATRGAGHRPAYRPDADHNTQRSYRLDTPLGDVEVIQMTGILARRLVSFVSPGSVGRKADRLGMIVLGSRVDVVLPASRVVPVVRVGQAVRAGSSSIARELP